MSRLCFRKSSQPAQLIEIVSIDQEAVLPQSLRSRMSASSAASGFGEFPRYIERVVVAVIERRDIGDLAILESHDPGKMMRLARFGIIDLAVPIVFVLVHRLATGGLQIRRLDDELFTNRHQVGAFDDVARHWFDPRKASADTEGVLALAADCVVTGLGKWLGGVAVLTVEFGDPVGEIEPDLAEQRDVGAAAFGAFRDDHYSAVLLVSLV